jgi:(E)-4-hydroxy-3-methyl-but-2-enyl pyrophosphate reductase
LKVEVAKTAGFCMGVTRAMDLALKVAREKNEVIYSLGPLIHNRQAVASLEAEGFLIAEVPEEIPEGTTVVIRAHGVRPEVREELEARGIRVIDATCPHVVASQKRIAVKSRAGFSIVIVGDRDHAEIKGLMGHAVGPVVVISSPEEVAEVELPEPLCIIAQTTFSEITYEKVVAEAQKRFPSIEIFESICSSTEDRQREVREMVKRVDAFVVVGARHSANTLRLAEIASESGKPTIHVETAAELSFSELRNLELVGVSAGASTPGWVIEEVIGALEAEEGH